MSAIRRSSTILDRVRAHYVARLGQPAQSAAFRFHGESIEVYKWDAHLNPQGVTLYATVGSSAHAAPETDATHRVEFFVGLEPPEDDVARPLAMVAMDSGLNGEILDDGHSITYPDPLWAGTAMNAFLVLRPRAEIVAPLVLPDGVHVEFHQLIPVFAAEIEYKARHGLGNLLHRWESSGVPFWNPRRSAPPTN